MTHDEIAEQLESLKHQARAAGLDSTADLIGHLTVTVRSGREDEVIGVLAMDALRSRRTTRQSPLATRE